MACFRVNFTLPAGTREREEQADGSIPKIYYMLLAYNNSRSSRRRNQDVDGRIILRWIFRKLEGIVGTGWIWLRIGTGGGHLWVR
jgi:hypothetical protein